MIVSTGGVSSTGSTGTVNYKRLGAWEGNTCADHACEPLAERQSIYIPQDRGPNLIRCGLNKIVSLKMYVTSLLNITENTPTAFAG